VIISERQGSENEPLFLLGEEVQAAVFRVHPYHHEIIGDMADLQSMSRTDLYHHYQANYIPGNAVLTIAGDFQTDQMLSVYTSSTSQFQPPRRRCASSALNHHKLAKGALP
jgi:zinc protease